MRETILIKKMDGETVKFNRSDCFILAIFAFYLVQLLVAQPADGSGRMVDSR